MTDVRLLLGHIACLNSEKDAGREEQQRRKGEHVVIISSLPVITLISQTENSQPPVEYVMSENICSTVMALLFQIDFLFISIQIQADKDIRYGCSDSVMT